MRSQGALNKIIKHHIDTPYGAMNIYNEMRKIRVKYRKEVERNIIIKSAGRGEKQQQRTLKFKLHGYTSVINL